MPRPRIIILMFHRVNDTSQGFFPEQFASYLSYLVKNFPIVIPGEECDEKKISICLTFDDAYFDFYHCVYPLLQNYQIKALLAISPKYIMEETKLDPAIRLSVRYPEGMDKVTAENKVPFCTWQELREMARTGLVLMGAHGYAHADLTSPQTNLSEEIYFAKECIEKALATPITFFVHPFGKTCAVAQQKIQETYKYGLRIGSALNYGWNNPQGYLYRIDAENLWPYHHLIKPSLIKKLTYKYWLNRLRHR